MVQSGLVATILVVQEDPILRASWSKLLETHGHEVLAEADVIEAVVRAREGGIDAVVLDTSDPGRSARTLLDELQRLPEPPPLILVSSSSKAPELSARLGAAAFVPKPCTPDEVAGVVAGVVNTYVRHHPDQEPTDRKNRDV